MAEERGLKLNEYGLFHGDEAIAGRTEEEMYSALGLDYIEPELRENRGEIQAAAIHALPALVGTGDMRGDLHAHTDLTDGRYTLEEMARAARSKGYSYLAMTDHSQRLTVARGLDAAALRAQGEAIDRFNAGSEGFVLLKGMEVDILEDGSLDLGDEALKELDLTVCSVHSRFNLSREKQTERILNAMEDPYFDILAHPTGRMINERPAYDVDMNRIMEEAKKRGCFLELNANPVRLDLTDIDCKMARERGIKVAISTDAHNISDLEFMRFGVGQARKGWLEKKDVLNALKLDELKAALRARRTG
jgi:DNA polymerase (family 10)